MNTQNLGTQFAFGAFGSLAATLIAVLHLTMANRPEEGLVITLLIIAAAGAILALATVAAFMNKLMPTEEKVEAIDPL